jgi:hypothetical protein
MRTHVYDKICQHIETMVPDYQRRAAMFLIFSELLQGNELGIDYLTKRYGTFTREHIGRSTFRRLLKQLQDDGLIKIDMYGHRTTHHAHHYVPTPAGHELMRTSSKAYWTYYDYQRKRNSITKGHPNLNGDYLVPEQEHYAEWLTLLPSTRETDQFINGLVQLESHPLIYRRYEANQHPAMMKRLFQLRNLPNDPFRVSYRPLRSGRLQSVPHTYIGKDLVPFIRPTEDPHLNKGILFSLDFSSQELRILASMLPSSSPIHHWSQNPDNHFAELLNIYDIKMPKHLWKGFMYSFLYGSQGAALKDALSYNEAIVMGHFSRWGAARSIVAEFTAKVPEVVSLREQFSEEFVQNHAIAAPGGVTRFVDLEDDLTKRGTIKKNRARSIPLSHVIQGAGAYIARVIVAKSTTLKYCRLHMPIHDGFVFYCKNSLFKGALAEAGSLLTSVTGDLIPGMEFPHKIEWVRGGNNS